MDVLGILSLLIALAAAAYLVWSRFLRPVAKAPAVTEVIHDRHADTIPPTLRPRSEISPKMLAAPSAASGAKRSPSTPPVPSPVAKKSALASAGDQKSKSATPRSEGAIEAAPVSEEPPSTQLAEASPKKPGGDIPKLNVEEDEELEPTKIGEAAVKAAPIQPVVEKIVFDSGADAPAKGPALALDVYGLGQTHPGKRRKQNQDAFVCLSDASVFVVADGMGGHRGGQTASRLAVKTIGEAFAKKQFDAAAHSNLPKEASELARSIQMANTAIFEAAKRDSNLEGMGTTVVAARFTEDRRRVYVAHVGDSRCYRIRDGVMKQMTSDHTMADYGVTGPEGAHLSRALGVWPTVPIDIIMAEPKLNDVYLICSDGLTKMVPESTIATQLIHEEDPKAAIDRLIFFANSHGGKDNITVLLVRVAEPGWKPPSHAG